jgi:hypothetical protein
MDFKQFRETHGLFHGYRYSGNEVALPQNAGSKNPLDSAPTATKDADY